MFYFSILVVVTLCDHHCVSKREGRQGDGELLAHARARPRPKGQVGPRGLCIAVQRMARQKALRHKRVRLNPDGWLTADLDGTCNDAAPRGDVYATERGVA